MIPWILISNDSVKFNLIFDDPLGSELSKEAELKGVTIEKLVEQILEEYVNTEKELIT